MNVRSVQVFRHKDRARAGTGISIGMPIPYTYVNLALVLLATSLDERRMYPMLFCNSAAVAVSFYAALLVDPTAKRRLMEWGDYTPVGFWGRDLLGHVAPLLLMAAKLRRVGKQPGVPPWIWSMAMHATWLAVVRRRGAVLDLSHVYVPMSATHWRAVWLCAAIAHVSALPTITGLRSAIPYARAESTLRS